MIKRKIIAKLKLPNVFVLLFIIFLSCALLIFVNYYTIKILSSTRAYVNGESHYSKAQKDATLHLLAYLYTKDQKQWKLFKEELKVPQGDCIARISLTNDGDINVIKNGFKAGRNDENDFDDIIWLFRNFQSVPFFAKAIREWKQGDFLISQLATIGNKVHKKTETSLSYEEKNKILLDVNILSDKLTINERNFSKTMGDGSRMVKDYLIYINIFFVLIIIGSVGLYYSIMVRKLVQSKNEIEAQNKNLTLANKELDRFVYSASHDLRSPITSLKGLIDITQIEDDPEQIKYYLNLMDQSLAKQDEFIGNIIDYSRNKRKHSVIEDIQVHNLVEEVISQHQHIKDVSGIIIKKKLLTDNILTDSLRLKIILNNLMSNAIKYSDKNKKDKYISIEVSDTTNFYKIEIEDNGIGIREEFKSKIFEMFFVTNSNMGSGLGLYIAKEAVENLNGNIMVDSKLNFGTTFTVTIPKPHET